MVANVGDLYIRILSQVEANPESHSLRSYVPRISILHLCGLGTPQLILIALLGLLPGLYSQGGRASHTCQGTFSTSTH